jgi:hypothetical protein
MAQGTLLGMHDDDIASICQRVSNQRDIKFVEIAARRSTRHWLYMRFKFLQQYNTAYQPFPIT